MTQTILNQDLSTEVTKMNLMNDLINQPLHEINLNVNDWESDENMPINSAKIEYDGTNMSKYNVPYMDISNPRFSEKAISVIHDMTGINFGASTKDDKNMRDYIHHHFKMKQNVSHILDMFPDVKQTMNNTDNKNKPKAINNIELDCLVQNNYKQAIGTLTVNYNNNKRYYKHLIYFKVDIENAQKLLENMLILQLDTHVKNNKVSESLRKLWFHQIQNDLDQNFDVERIDNKILNTIFENVKNDMLSGVSSSKIPFTYRELFEFFKEVKQKHITEQTERVQRWFTYSNDLDIKQSIINHDNFQHLNQMTLASYEESERLKHVMFKQSHFKNRMWVSKIYKISDEKPLPKGMARFTGSHGTRNKSLLSILLNGFKTTDELRNGDYEYEYNGNALGDGVYFARLHQSSKSSNYIISSSQANYLIIADVDYDPNNVHYTQHFDNNIPSKSHSLVVGQNVARFNTDEVLAPHSQNINIRYIVECYKRR